MKTDPTMPARKSDQILTKKKKRDCHLVGFANQAGSQSFDKGKRKTWGLKKLWNMKVTKVLIIIGALEKIPMNLEKKLRVLEI